MLVTVRNLSKAYGAINVLNEISFVVNTNNRVGLVGSNGVGGNLLPSGLNRMPLAGS